MWGSTIDHFVRIPDGTHVVLDESPPALAGVNVSGGQFTFARRNLTLETGFVPGTDRGEFRTGTDENPFEHDARVTLTGNRSDLPGRDSPDPAGDRSDRSRDHAELSGKRFQGELFR